jgi:transcriptional regulator with XRE-family HTH domain
VPWCVPIRPSQMSPDQLRRWRERRELVGGRIRELRISRELTQEALGLEAGLSRVMVIKIESGEKSVAYERLWDLAAVLGVDVVDFLSPPANTSSIRSRRKGRVNSPRSGRSDEPDKQ